MNTPQFDWSRNKLDNEYLPVGGVFDPDVAAEATWRAVRDGPRELWVGGSAVQAIVDQMIAPGLLDRYIAKAGWVGQLTHIPNPHEADNLYQPVAGRQGARGRFGAVGKPVALIVDPAKLRLAIGATTVTAVALLASRLLRRQPPRRLPKAAHGH